MAYCDPPGPLEPAEGVDDESDMLPTLFAVSPAPAGGTTTQVASFYREYNRHMLRNLTVHEAMPGHVLQLAHARRYRGNTDLRAAARAAAPSSRGGRSTPSSSSPMPSPRAPPAGVDVEALRMQQLKMRLRSTINAILDVRVHARGMTRDEAMRLMTVRGHQEDSEAAGKWRRALLTSAQLVHLLRRSPGGVRRSCATCAAEQPGQCVREVNDTVLAHGSPSPRLLRLLLELVSG